MLILTAILTGIAAALAIRFTTRPHALLDARNRIYARLLEFRLFFDDPWLIWKAQIALVHDNLHLLRLLLPATLLLVLPLAWLYQELDHRYGTRPLRPGEAAVVTAKLVDRPTLTATGDVAIETPPIRIPRENLVVWRIRVTGTGPFELHHQTPIQIDYPKTAATIPWQAWWTVLSTAAALLTTRTCRLR